MRNCRFALVLASALLLTCFSFQPIASGQNEEARERPGRRPGTARRGSRGGERARPQSEAPPEAKADEKQEAKQQQEKQPSKPKQEGEKKAESNPTPKQAVKKVTPALPSSAADQVKWRSIGPANMGGRITALTVYEKDPCIWWAATASGGLLKTTNNGNTFEHQFDQEATVSIGDVQVAQSNPDIVWVGTGESNPRNSVSWGDGVYKSTDGGKTWKNMGLEKTFQTGALAIHPENPDIVWVGSLGRLWGPNPDRGLYRTADGGKTWSKVLYVNDKTGVIDVQVNPKNPDELLVATYERKRDGFDGNDPVQRFGEGSGIYKSTDGGLSFMKVTEGLPTCKMGRIGLDYFEADPKVVVAIIESEKIAKEPENYSYIGIRGENADVGARMTRVTADGPADKSGMKDGDIVVSVDGNIITSYNDFLMEIHKHQAGETVKAVVSRDRKLVDIDLKLEKRPSSGSARRRSDFTGTLGGQSANRQETQGPDGHEYGGIYISEDGGESWKRINSLNPRPMYYSNIQIDPVDKNNIYVCGTSLYKSKDGGKTFTGDGGTDGIHVDHHALWIDKKDPRHMILGNDGGVYITWDRMTHWDHYNHVAIGQFYHVGVDANLDYNVYGGLQDNGSWGGPSRGKTGSGPVNTDWFRVGGGDGFVTLADPDDANQIYFESQNGGMGRIHLETGARGFIRPSERGKRFRFNWKTPFVLSPHNSKIHYSAGNYVFRSYNKGDKIRRISPEIVNSSKGAGSAITESPVEPGVLYVGTTDGAVWMTKDGGNEWMPLFYKPAPKEEPKKEEPKKEQEGSAKTSSETKGESKSEGKPNSIAGSWIGRYQDERIPEDRAEFEFKLVLTDNKLTGEMEGRRGPQDISEATYNQETGDVSWLVESERGDREYTGKLKDGTITGMMSAGGGRFEMEFEAKKSGGKKDPARSQSPELGLNFTTPIAAMTAAVIKTTQDDEVSGEWTGLIESENVPGGRLEFTIDMKVDEKMNVRGAITSVMGVLEIVEGTYDAKKKAMEFEAENDDVGLTGTADVIGKEMSGVLTINNGELEIDFTATKNEVKAETKEEPKQEKEKPAEEAKPAEKAEPKQASSSDQSKADPNDPVSGTWSGVMVSPQGEREMTLVLKRASNDSITGTFESSRGERDISSGSYNPETKMLKLTSESEQISFVMSGMVNDGSYEGEFDINDGAFTMEFNAKRKSAKAQETKPKTTEAPKKETATNDWVAKVPKGDKSLSSLMPGPRWVSSVEASRFKAGRCYITFDGHRSNDDGIYLFVTNDYGQTWESLKNNLPNTAGSVRVLREDVENENVLYLGCEFSSWCSIDGGATWTKFAGGLPTVSVHEFAVHPKAGEVVAGTHGRSLWIADVSTLRQLSKDSLAKAAELYQPKEAIRWQRKPGKGSSGTRKFTGQNPASGTTIAYSLGKSARQVSLEIVDMSGNEIKTFEAPRTKGLHSFQWDLTRDSANSRFRQSVGSGNYLVVLKVDGERMEKRISVVPQPGLSAAATLELERQEETRIEELLNEF